MEKRELLAADLDAAPRLIGVNPNSEDIFSENTLNLLESAPDQLTFRFDGGQEIDPGTFSGIRVTAAGGDDSFGEANDEQIIPGFLGFADDDNSQTIVFRFAEPLEDDRYRIQIFGEDNANEGIVAVRNVDGEAFRPDDGTNEQVIDFDIELGAQVVAVVPQPIERDASGALNQLDGVVDVYFDDVELLGSASILDRSFYQLISTNDTVSNNDDEVFIPIVGGVDAVLEVNPEDQSESVRVRLDFGAALGTLSSVNGDSTLRLRVGNNSVVASSTNIIVPDTPAVALDPGSTLVSANEDLGTFGSGDRTIRLQETIEANLSNQLVLDYPGADDEPGSRDADADAPGHVEFVDSDIGVTQFTYSFGLGVSYGFDANGNEVFSTINPEQIERTREVFEFYGSLLGIDFVESVSPAAVNLIVSVGDLFPLGGTLSGPGGVAGLEGGGQVVLDGAENWNDGVGQSFFNVMLHEVGHALGLGHTFDLAVSIMGGGTIAPTDRFNQFVFPGTQDVIHARHLHRPDNLDVDLYEFEVAAGVSGILTAETFAERLVDQPSLLDTRLTLFQETPDGLVQIAGNDDYFSQDSLIRTELSAGTYYLGVAASADVNFDPEVNLSGSGGFSEGAYELLVDFEEIDTSSGIVDANGSFLDGDFDGQAGGLYNFWFRPNTANNTVFVDKAAPDGGDGSLASPFRTIPDAVSNVELSQVENSVIRVVGNAAVGSDLTTSEPYLIGRATETNEILEDGVRLEVPANTTLVIDAGAILKFSNSAIHVGSDGGGADRNNGAIQTLGTPQQSVFLTSYSDATLGDETNPIDQTPDIGDWGGIEIRNDIDRAQGNFDLESEGIFLNYIGNTRITYGGGVVETSIGSRVVDPILLAAARPELTHNLIQFSDGQAISADPASFEETTFNEPVHQFLGDFVPDYTRVGPDIHGNTLIDNPINGLLVRVETFAGNDAPELTVTGRFDDTDIVHTLGETLVVSGTPGGQLRETTTPAGALIQTTASSEVSTFAANDSVSYRVTFVDVNGFESFASVATPAFTVGAANDSVQLDALPSVIDDYVSRRLYRSTNGGAFDLVARLDGDSSSFTDVGETLPATLAASSANIFSATGVRRSRLDGALVIDPGVIIKGASVRIDVEIGATLIAEGTPDQPIVFTSRSDDRYGAGGTFDLSSDGISTGSAGDWAGIYGAPFSRISIDNSVIAFGGGSAAIPGGFGQFNAVELHQAEARISNVLFENNAAGAASSFGSLRGEFVSNSPAVVYVAGAEPFIVNNTFVRNQAAPISINAEALSNTPRRDFGRQASSSDVFVATPGNVGPVFEGNQLANNALNGVIVRGQTINAEVVLDDTDIVHIIEGEILVPDITHDGGLRLQSTESESLVVKFTPGSTLTATGHPLDIADRIGGRIQIIGSPSFPVILTSLSDDSIGAGFGPDGTATVDTNGDGPSTGTAGDWAGILLDEFSHDRNIATLRENEGAIGGFGDSNSVPANAQQIGLLAEDEVSGDENLRLGFDIHGTIADDSDVDVYSFDATAGTHIWIDIDRTDSTLDSVVELVDSNGRILALSDNSNQESTNRALPSVPAGSDATQLGLPMQQNPLATFDPILNPLASVNAIDGSYRDLYSTNPNDAGLRVTLPAGGTYFIRVRSSNLEDSSVTDDLFDESKLRDGRSQGSYNLHVRLGELDEFGGSTINHADIRFATDGITTFGLPANSPLAGNGTAIANGSVELGNIGNTERAALSLGGAFTATTSFVDFTFSLFRDSIQEITQPGATTVANDDHFALTFDVDYADGLGQPDVNLFLYYGAAQGTAQSLIAFGTGSNILADQVDGNTPGDLSDLSAGSLGVLDAFLGSQELTEGFYTLRLANNSVIPADLQEFFGAPINGSPVRVEPIEGFARLGEDRFEINGTVTLQPTTQAGSPVIFGGTDAEGLLDAAVDFGLGDVPLWAVVDTQGGSSRLLATNPFIGGAEARVGADFNRVGALAVNPATGLPSGFVTLADNNQTDGSTGQFLTFDPRTGGFTTSAGAGFQTVERTVNNAGNAQITTAVNGNNAVGFGQQIEALSFVGGNQLYGVGHRGEGQQTWTGATLFNDANGALQVGAAVPDLVAFNFVYRLNPNTGAVIQPTGIPVQTGIERGRANPSNNNPGVPDGTQFTPQEWIPSASPVVGLADIGGTLFAVDSGGGFFSIGGPNNNGDLVGGVQAIPSPGQTLSAPVALGFNIEAGVPGFGFDATSNNKVLDEFGVPIAFTDLTSGLLNLDGTSPEGIPYNQILFGTDASNNLHAFDVDGNLQHVFSQGRSSIPLNLGDDIQGIALSNLDINLWHVTDTDANPTNHFGTGSTLAINGLRNNSQNNGGQSLFFGFEDPTNNNQNQDDAGFGTGANAPNQFGTLDFASGAQGSVESQVIDLSDYSAGDLPTLYFDYLADIDANRDAFRVYVSGNNGQWTLLTTPTDNGQQGWGQARLSLAPWAGQDEVRIRFEFSSGGEALPYQAQLYAAPADQLTDGDVISLNNTLSGAFANLEVDFGALLNLPTGAAINAGDTLTLFDPVAGIPATTFTYTQTAGGGANTIFINDSFTPAQVATVTNAAIQAAGFTTVSDPNRPQLVNIPSATIISNSLPAGTQIGNSGVFGVNVPLQVTIADTVTDIRETTRVVLANTFNIAGQETNVDVYPTTGADGILLYDFSFTNLGPFRAFGGQNTGAASAVTPLGPFGIYDPSFGGPNPNLTAFAGRFQNDGPTNAGVFIDNIIVGLAERGELVRNGTGITNPIPNQNATPADLDFGSFQVEVRTSAEFGVSLSAPPLPLMQQFGRASYDSNDIVGEGFGVIATNAAQISDGDTFTLSNGIDLVTFEFDDLAAPNGVTSGNIAVPFQSSFTDVQLADSLLDTFNSQAVGDALGLTAQTVSGQISGATTNRLVFLGPASVDQLGGVDFGLPGVLTTVLYGTEAFVGTELGDDNRERDQGQLIIENTIVRNSSGTGIIIDAGERDRTDRDNRTGTALPRPGSPINFPTPNTAGLLPGAVLRGNIVADNATGIVVSGDGGGDAGVPYVRVVNNTVVGNQVGVAVDSGAAPTLLNNIISTNSTIGIQVPAAGGNATSNISRQSTVVGGTLFHNNGIDINNQAISSLSINADGTQVFVDAGAQNFYPEEFSLAIDASLSSLPDRPALVNVRGALGIPPSPVLAPPTDIFGQTHENDLSVNPPAGLGGSVFVDIGAIDRADNLGPQATILTPLDNDAVGNDLDGEGTRIQLASGTLDSFEILISELSGSGPDAASVTAERVYVTENGQLLEEGRDYVFGYNASNRLIRLTPLSGVWRPDAVYEITLNNRSRLEFQAPDGESIADGDQLTVADNSGVQRIFEFDAGFAVAVPQTLGLEILNVENGFSQGDTFTIADSNTGESETFEINLAGVGVGPGNISVDLSTAGTITEIRDAIFDAISDPAIAATLNISPTILGNDSLQLGSVDGQTLTTSFAGGGAVAFGQGQGVTDGQVFTYQADGRTTTFEFDDDGSVVTGGDLVAIPFSRTDTSDELAQAIAAAAASANIGLDQSRSVGDGVVVFGGASENILDVANSSLELIATPGVTGSLSIEVAAGESSATLDGSTFTVTIDGTVETFTLSTTEISGARVVLLDPADDEAAIASEIAAQIALAFPSSTAPTSSGRVVIIGESVDSLASVVPSTTSLVVEGVSGGASPIAFFPGEQFSSVAAASGLIRAIEGSGLNISAFTPGSGIVLLDNGNSVDLLSSEAGTTASLGSVVDPIVDIGENNLLANRINSETAFTIVMPLVELDFGDAFSSATDTFQTSLAGNGARHASGIGALPRLGVIVDTESDSLSANSDDALVAVDAVVAGISPFVISGPSDQRTVELTAIPTVGQSLQIVVGANSEVFEFTSSGAIAAPGSIAVEFDVTDSVNTITTNLVNSIRQLLVAQGLAASIEHDAGDLVTPADTQFTLIAESDEDGVNAGTFNDGTTTQTGLFLAPGVREATTASDVVGFLNRSDSNGTVIDVIVTGSGLLDVFIDFNGDGDFGDAAFDEHNVISFPVVDGVNPIQLNTPANAALGSTFARFRLSTAGSDTPGGIASDGEVEDFVVEVFDIAEAVPNGAVYQVNEDEVLTADGTNGILPLSAFDTLPAEAFVSPEYIIDAARIAPFVDPITLQPRFVFETTNGTVELLDPDSGTGAFIYTPNPDYFGPDEFVYSITTQRNQTIASPTFATVSITVNPVNDAPTASDVIFPGLEDNLLTITAAELLAQSSAGGQGESNQELFVLSVSNSPFVIFDDPNQDRIDATNQNAVLNTQFGTLTADFEFQAFFTTPLLGTDADLDLIDDAVDVDITLGTDSNGDGIDDALQLQTIAEVQFQPSPNFNSFISSSIDPNTGAPFVDAVGQFILDHDFFFFELQDDGVALLPDGTLVPGTPLRGSARADLNIRPDNDLPELGSDTVGISNPDYVNFFANQGLVAPTPTEDTAITIPTDFLLANDRNGPLGDPVAANPDGRGAIDELAFTAGNDGSIQVTGVSVDPSFGQITLGALGNIVFTPAPEVFGLIPFNYTVTDSGVSEDQSGNRFADPESQTQQSFIFVEPVNDQPVAFDRSLVFTELVEPATTPIFTFTRADLLNGNSANTLPSGITVANGTITVPDGTSLTDGATVTLFDASGIRRFVEFNTTGVQSRPDINVIQFAVTDTADSIATSLQAELFSIGVTAFAAGSDVTLANVVSTVNSPDSSSLVANAGSVTVQDGLTLRNGESLSITDTDGTTLDVVFNTSGELGAADAVVQYALSDTAQDIAVRLQDVLIANGIGASSVAGTSVVAFESISSVATNTAGTLISTNANSVTLVDPGSIVFGETITLSDGVNNTVVEFNTTGTPAAGTDVVVVFTLNDTADIIAASLESQVRALGFGATANGPVVTFSAVANATTNVAPTQIIDSASSVTVPGSTGLIQGETLTVTLDNGFSQTIEFTSTGIPSLGSDAVVQYFGGETSDVIATRLQTTLASLGISASVLASTVTFGATDIAATTVSETDASPADVANNIASPFNESVQRPDLEIVEFGVGALTVVGDAVGVSQRTLTTVSGGTLTFNFDDGVFVDGRYDAAIDRNLNSPTGPPVDEFTYVIRDNGATEFTDGTLLSPPLPSEESLPATVTLTVTPANDAPSFDLPSASIDILEDEDADGNIVGGTEAVRNGVITNVLPGPVTAGDENISQTVTSVVLTELSSSPANLLRATPTLDVNGTLLVQTTPNLIGTAVYQIAVQDSLGAISTADITINVRPVNDPPAIDGTVVGTSDNNNDLDDQWTVGTNGEIAFTLPEDNTQAGGDTSQPFFIPFEGVNGRIGLTDVFVGGPNVNESDSSPGGSQSVSVFSTPVTTDLGGLLTPVIVNGEIIGLNYTPPTNFNNIDENGNLTANPADFFDYVVEDNSEDPTNPDVETFSLLSGVLVDDPQRQTNRVILNLRAVNDRPEATIAATFIELPEFDPAPDFDPNNPLDLAANRHTVANFASNVSAGPTTSAFDEINVQTGQTVTFNSTAIASGSLTSAEIEALFIEQPSIDENGTLSFLAQPDVFGQFLFEIQLSDSGPDDVTRGDLNTALPTTITINVRPINDPPVLLDDAPELAFELLEDGTVDILVFGDTITTGLLDPTIFAPGPPNESSNITPGGNQTLSLALPLPASTAQGGTLTPVFESSEGLPPGQTPALISFIYTPRQDFTGEDSFIYTVIDDGITVDVGTDGAIRQDPRLASNTVRLNVVAVNDQPQFSGGGDVRSDEDAGLVSIPNWVTNVQAGPTTAVDEIASQTPVLVITEISSIANLFVTAPQATVDANGNATLTYQTAPDANGVAVFEVFLDDQGPTDVSIGDVSQSPTQTFTITVDPVNDPPTFVADAVVENNEDQNPFIRQFATDISPGPADEADQTVTFTVTVAPEDESLFSVLPTIDESGVLRFVTNPNAVGVADVTVSAQDSAFIAGDPVGPVQNLQIRILEQPDTPVAVPDTLSGNEDTRIEVPLSQLLANDIDPDLATNPAEFLQVVLQSSTSISGVPVSLENGQLIYDPTATVATQSLAENEILTDSISYSLVDSDGLTSNTVTVSLSITGINDAPVASADNPVLNPNGPTVINPLANDTDIDGVIDPSSILITLQPAFGSISIDDTTGAITYTPFLSFNQVDLFSYTVADDLGTRSAETTIEISSNSAPLTLNDAAATFLNEPVSINVALNDSDVDGLDLNSIVIVRQPSRGEAIPQGNGIIQYVPEFGFIGDDSFEYTIADSLGRTGNAATVNVEVISSRLQNPNLFSDVNADGNVSALDALLIINALDRANVSPIPVLDSDRGPLFLDPNGDQSITALDALVVINDLEDRPVAGQQVTSSFLTTSTLSTEAEGEEVAPIGLLESESQSVIDASVSEAVDAGLIDLIAEDRENEEDDETIEAIDAALSLLL